MLLFRKEMEWEGKLEENKTKKFNLLPLSPSNDVNDEYLMLMVES